jgi:hypothetical protein
MTDTLFIILVLIVAIGAVVGVAYLLDKPGKKSNAAANTLPKTGTVGNMLLWIARILGVVVILSIVGAFVFNSLPLVWLAASCLTLYILDGIIYRIVRSSGR